MTNQIDEKEFNRLAAEFLGIFSSENFGRIYVINKHDRPVLFDPYNDANDMLLLEEKLEIHTGKEHGKWWSWSPLNDDVLASGNTTHESRRACAWEYLRKMK